MLPLRRPSLFHLVPLALWGFLTITWIVGAPTIALAQDVSRPDAASPATGLVPPQVSADESLAIAREYALRDSVLRARREQVDSLRRARREAANRAGKPKRSPAFGDAPFFGYTWVFYADIVAGAAIGLALFLGRRRKWSDFPAPTWWAVLAMIAGGIGGAATFIVCFVLAIFASVIAFFGEPASPITLFGWTLGAMLVAALLVKLPWPGNRRMHPW
jgi:hypothetical protein